MPTLFPIANEPRSSMVNAGVASPIRSTRYGDLIATLMRSGLGSLALAGAHYTFVNPTMGTGIAGPNKSARNPTGPLLVVRSMSGQMAVTYVRLICTAVAASGTSLMFDMGYREGGADLYVSGGTLLVPANCRSDKSILPGVAAYFGTPVAAGGWRSVTNWFTIAKSIAAPAMVVGDEYLFMFGVGKAGPTNPNSSVAGRNIFHFDASICITGLGGFGLECWSPGSTGAPSFEVEVGVLHTQN